MHNFSAGPAVLPSGVLEAAQKEMLNHNGSGRSVMELSHRSPEYAAIQLKAKKDLADLLHIPEEDYAILFMQGGATAQFSSIALNFAQKDKPADYCVSGTWSHKAALEAQRMGVKTNNTIPPTSDWFPFSPDPSYIFYVSNETIGGVEADDQEMLDSFPSNVPVICDMSSNILSRSIQVHRYACIFAGAQKNIGPAGVTIAIIRKSLLPQSRITPIPITLDYSIIMKADSMYNTPPTYSIYVAGLVFRHLLDNGGVEQSEKDAREKARIVYDAIARRPDVYFCPVTPAYRSRMNIPFRILKAGQVSVEAEEMFLMESKKRGMVDLKGHRSVGGIRASCYNALRVTSVNALASLMDELQIEYAGPGVLPFSVLETAQKELLDYNGSGRSVMELSHRSPEYEKIHFQARRDLATLLDVPEEDYAILFMQGGASAQFSAIALNFGLKDKPADYCVSGEWSKKAVREAENMGVEVNTIFQDGVEADDQEMLDSFPPNVPVICDMSSNILSRPIQVQRYACIFAGASKNMGPAGVTIAIVRKSLLPKTHVYPVPATLNYLTLIKADSLYNTAPTYSIYIAGLVFRNLLENGGVKQAEKKSAEKAKLIYDAISRRPGFYSNTVPSAYRSRMNIPFRILRAGEGDHEAEAAFVKESKLRGMIDIKGHRAVGGLRASCYLALDLKSVRALVELMDEFRKRECL